MIATAIPRRRVNQSEVSAMIGANVAELAPPTSRPWARMKCQRLVAWLAATYPGLSAIAPPAAGQKMPKRSERGPHRKPPNPKTDIVEGWGSGPAHCADPNPAWTAGR